MLPDAGLPALLRFLVAGALVTVAAVAYQDEIVRGLLPLFRGWLDLIDDTYVTVNLAVITEHGESMVRRLATPTLHIAGGKMIYPDPRILYSNETTTGMVLQPLVLAIALVFAWPWRTYRELAVRSFVALALMTFVLLLDVPLILYGFAWYEELKKFDPDATSPLVAWADAMNAGGRFAMTLLAACAAIAFGRATFHHAGDEALKAMPPATPEVLTQA